MELIELIIQPNGIIDEDILVGYNIESKLIFNASIVSYSRDIACDVSRFDSNSINVFTHGELADFLLDNLSSYENLLVKGRIIEYNNNPIFVLKKAQLFTKGKNKTLTDKSVLLKTII